MDSVELSVAQVVVPRPLPGPLSYLIPEDLLSKVKLGSYVQVQFRSSTIEGFVVGFTSLADPSLKGFELKEVLSCPFEIPVFSQKDLDFFQWISNYYQLPIGEVFHSAFPKQVFKIPKTKKKKESSDSTFEIPKDEIALTPDQQSAMDAINSGFSSQKFKSFLLYGVTGSGKTEVYIRSAQRALELGRSALILVPEIALTPQLRRRFEDRFGDEVAVLHSSLGEKTRREFWWDILNEKRRVVVGARSALFAPLKNIGLIVVDEEHEASYKQEDRLRYNARDLALVRASQHQAIALLGSATPSIETFFAAENKKHELLQLQTRPSSRPMPTIEIVDMKEVYKAAFKEFKSTRIFLSQKLCEGLTEALGRGEQAMIFVNRKGFASFLICKDCGEVPKCVNCSVSLTYYQRAGELRCHYCGLQTPAFDQCPKCHSLNLQCMGMGTELIEDEVRQLYPEAKIARLDADTADTVKKLEEALEKFRSGETQILVGTQMLAKGHDFPNVTFVGVVLADLNLHLPDFRAGERTFQLLAQVAGRAGRGDKPGKVVLQTLLPEHYVIQCASKQDYLSFYHQEIEQRQVFGYPPFSRMAQIEFRNMKEDTAKAEASQAKALLDHLRPETSGFMYLGPAPASIARIANQFRWQILLKSEKSSALNAVIKTLRKKGVKFIDVDPVTTL